MLIKKKKFPSLRQRSISNLEKKISGRVHYWTNGFRHKYNGNRYTIQRFVKPHQYTHAGLFHHDPVVLKIAKLTSYQAYQMTWNEVNHIAIENMKKELASLKSILSNS